MSPAPIKAIRFGWEFVIATIFAEEQGTSQRQATSIGRLFVKGKRPFLFSGRVTQTEPLLSLVWTY